MKKPLLAAGLLVAAGGVVAVLLLSKRGNTQTVSASTADETPGPGVEYKLQQAAAIETAVRAVPITDDACDTAYNQALAYNKAADGLGLHSAWKNMPPRDAFMQMCSSLPLEAQRCMQPRYTEEHAEECEPIRRKYKPKSSTPATPATP
jgi:hypothetical protein